MHIAREVIVGDLRDGGDTISADFWAASGPISEELGYSVSQK